MALGIKLVSYGGVTTVGAWDGFRVEYGSIESLMRQIYIYRAFWSWC